MTAHSKIGASSMSRWAKCPGSVRLSSGIPSTTSSYAEEGTKAHELAEKILGGAYIDYSAVDFEMLDHVHVYTNYVKDARFRAIASGVEERFDLSEIYPGLFGTCDAWIYKDETLEIVDLKFGQGIAVEAEDNVQLKYYALGALLKLKLPCKKIKMTIVQPRCFHPDGPIRSSEISTLDLFEFSADLEEAAKRTEDPNAELKSGDHCRFCPAAPTCPELSKTAMTAAQSEFSPTHTYSVDDLATALSKVDAVESWVKNIRSFAQKEAERGVEIPGYKLVARRAHRKWKDEDKIEEQLLHTFGLSFTEVRKPAELKSPAQIEALIGKVDREKLEQFVVKESSGSTLVPVSDKRKTTKPAIETEFTKITQE